MHYKNGRAPKNGDQVITTDCNNSVVSGIIFNLCGASCTCDVATLIPGGSAILICKDVKTMLHIEDALAAVENTGRVDIDISVLAGVIYDSYCDAVGGVAFNGDVLPKWASFSADQTKGKQSLAWVSAANAARVWFRDRSN